MEVNLTHSYSSIKLFENCPLRYYEQRVAKSVVDLGHEASVHGDRIHKAIEARVKGDAALPQDMETYEPLVAATTRLVGNGELHVEKELTINKQMQPTGWWDEDAWLRSKLDILIIKDDDTALVMDWKTGKRRADMFQLRLFAAQVFLHYPQVQKVKTTLVWFKANTTDSETYSRDRAAALWEDVLSRIHRIEQAKKFNNWPAKPSGLCPYCPLSATCKFAFKR